MSRRDELLARMRALVEEAGDEAGLLAEMRAILEERSAAEPRAEAESWHGMIGDSPPMLELRRRIEKFAPAAAPVLVTGESGTGKELVAKALHELSPRHAEAFVSENCAAIPQTLLESVLFGHVRGSFTGAVRDHPGHFVSAHRGTLFLDEIGDMPLAMQVKLLRVLQEGEVRPVGGSKVRKVDVRVIAASNQDLAQLVRDGTFREDLLYRLNALQVHLPPLRERGDDVIVLARHFLAEASRRSGRDLRFDESAEKALRGGRWPGNVRQLQNEVQRAATLCEGPVIRAGDLSQDGG